MLERHELLGSWRLIAAWEMIDGVVTDRPGFGLKPNGYIHYLADGRMAVMIAHENRQPITGDDPAERLEAARSFTAYGGTWTLTDTHVIHHVDICSTQAGVGCDYVRIARIEGDRLKLRTPPSIPEGRPMALEWERIGAC